MLDSLTPLLRVHEELVDELRCFVHGHMQRSTVNRLVVRLRAMWAYHYPLCVPAIFSSQDFEEINLASIEENMLVR